MSLSALVFQWVDAIRAADYPHQTQGPDAMLDCIDMDAAHASQMLDAYEKEHDNALARIIELETEIICLRKRPMTSMATPPVTEGDYLTYGTWPDGKSYYSVFEWKADKWIVLYDLDVTEYITHYMPLPEVD